MFVFYFAFSSLFFTHITFMAFLKKSTFLNCNVSLHFYRLIFAHCMEIQRLSYIYWTRQNLPITLLLLNHHEVFFVELKGRLCVQNAMYRIRSIFSDPDLDASQVCWSKKIDLMAFSYHFKHLMTRKIKDKKIIMSKQRLKQVYLTRNHNSRGLLMDKESWSAFSRIQIRLTRKDRIRILKTDIKNLYSIKSFV